MAARPSWEGYLRFNLLSVPVKAYNASVSGAGKVSFHMIHAKCHSRIRYKKVCPIHGEVPNEEIVSGYELAKGKYAVVDKGELKKLLPEDDQAVNIDVFIRPDELDPIYYGDRSYYLIPDGRIAEKPYAVLQRVMAEQDRFAVAQMILSGREHAVLVRPVDGLLAMTLLNYEEQVKPAAAFHDDVPSAEVSPAELKLAESLVEAATADEFNFARYQDEYTHRVTKLLESKGRGKKGPAERHQDEPAVINLMDALRQSLDRTKRSKAARRGKATSKRSTHRRKARKTG